MRVITTVLGIGACSMGIGIDKILPNVSGYWFLIPGIILTLLGLFHPLRKNVSKFIIFIRKRTKKDIDLVVDDEKGIVNQYSNEIDENLWHIHGFWRKYSRTIQGIKQGFEQFQDLPNWYRVIFEQYPPFGIFIVEKAQQVEQFYNNLDNITKLYNEISNLNKKDITNLFKLTKQFESLITEVLEQGNPLKK